MSRPIDIPGNRPGSRRRITPENNAFPSDEGPYFGYIDLFESGEVQWAVSSGFDQYVEVGPQRPLPSLAFIVEKDRISKSFNIEITSLSLKQHIYRAIMNQVPSPVSPQLDFEVVLKHYDALKLQSQRLDTRRPHDKATAEMRLLVNDLLLERGLYDGIGMEGFRQRQVLCATHLHDIHLRNLDAGLDEIEDCFSLGLIPDEINQEYMHALNFRYAELARSGDHNGLHNLCEPIVRSGQIELQYNPALLIEVLDQGHMDVYLYMLDLVDRTRDSSTEFLDPNFSDVTLDPFYVAIRLGQLEVARSFVRESASFEGRASDGFQSDGHVFTPLSAAVFWNRPAIVRLLLESGPVYSAGYQQALALALAGNLEEILQIFTESQHRHQGTSQPLTDGFLSPPLLGAGASEAQRIATSDPVHGDFGTSRSVSEITNSLSSMISGQAPPVDQGSSGLVDPLLLASPQLGWSAASPEASFAQPGQPSHVESEMQAKGQAPRPIEQPPEAPHPFVRQRPAHTARRKLGRDLVVKLKYRCVKLSDLCNRNADSARYAGLQSHFSSMEDTWERGVEVFRKITRNEPPTSLVEVLQCLLVADVLSCQISQGDPAFRSRFINDLGRWRAVLNDSEHAMFDDIAGAIWDVTDVTSLDISQSGADEIYHFQELIQNIVSLEKMGSRLPLKKKTLGRRLQTIRGRVEGRRQVPPLAQYRPKAKYAASFQNIGRVLGRLTKDTDSADEEEIDWGDFIHLDALEEADETPDVSREEPPQALFCTPWKHIHSMVVFLLASVAFSVVLILVSAIQDSLEDSIPQTIQELPSGYALSCAVVEDFVDFKAEPWGASMQSNVRQPSMARSGGFIDMMKKSTRRGTGPRSLGQSLANSGSYKSVLRASMSSPSGSSFLSTDLSSTDVEATRPSNRFRCLSVKCPKTFSSVSNRNKHMHEGCAFGDKRGYRCRNASCTKVLSTKWYRNTHEQTRCRFR